MTNRGELHGRFDPYYYQEIFIRLQHSLNNSKYPLETLGRLSTNIINGYDCRNFVEDGLTYLRVGNIGRDAILLENVKYIPETEITEKIFLEEGNVLLTRKGSYGLATVVNKDMLDIMISSEIFLIKLRDIDKTNPQYISAYLNSKIGRLYFERIKTGAIMGHISQNALQHTPIVIPPKAVQSEIVAKMAAAYAAKKEKEAEAQRLLDSIDDYLLGELGIELPEEAENTVEGRVFVRQFSEVSGGRFDAPIHHKKYSLQTPKYPMARFRDCVNINPLTSLYHFPPETLATFIPMERVTDRYGEADISQYRSLQESGGYTKFQDNDLLWAKITPCMQNGKSAVVANLRNGIGFGSTEFHVFRAKLDIDIRYIHAVLRLRSLKNHATLYFSGSAGHQRVASEFFEQLNIPKPPLEKQREIANHITEIRNQAKQLQEQAAADLRQAKQAVEAMILGN